MTILLLGAGPRLAWVRSVLETLRAPSGSQSEIGAGIVVVEGDDAVVGDVVARAEHGETAAEHLHGTFEARHIEYAII